MAKACVQRNRRGENSFKKMRNLGSKFFLSLPVPSVSGKFLTRPKCEDRLGRFEKSCAPFCNIN